MRYFFNPFNFVLIALVVGAGLAAMTVLLNTLLPDFVRRGRNHATQHFWRAFLIGLINVLFFGVITLALMRAPGGLGRFLGATIATIFLAFLMLGASVVARVVGEKLRPGDASVTKQVLAGIVTIELAEMVPLVGWIVVPLVAASTGLGAVILALFKRVAPTQGAAASTQG